MHVCGMQSHIRMPPACLCTQSDRLAAMARVAAELDQEDHIVDDLHLLDIAAQQQDDDDDVDDDVDVDETSAKSRGMTNLAISLGSQERVAQKQEHLQPSAASVAISHLPQQHVDELLIIPADPAPASRRRTTAPASRTQQSSVYSASTANIMASQHMLQDPTQTRRGASNLTQFNVLAANHQQHRRKDRACTTDGECVVA